MQLPIALSGDSQVAFSRRFHVEVLRGSMNRLLLRAMPTADEPTRMEVFFQYVQHLDMPMVRRAHHQRRHQRSGGKSKVFGHAATISRASCLPLGVRQGSRGPHSRRCLRVRRRLRASGRRVDVPVGGITVLSGRRCRTRTTPVEILVGCGCLAP